MYCLYDSKITLKYETTYLVKTIIKKVGYKKEVPISYHMYLLRSVIISSISVASKELVINGCKKMQTHLCTVSE